MPATSIPQYTFDALDLRIAEAMCLAALGPDSGISVEHGDGCVTVSLTPAAAAAITEVTSTPDPHLREFWVELVEPSLIEEVVDRVGADWRAEAELAVGLALAVRGDEAHLLAASAIQGPVTVPTTRGAADLIAADVPYADWVYLV